MATAKCIHTPLDVLGEGQSTTGLVSGTLPLGIVSLVWALRKDGHEAATDLRAVPGVGAELVLSVDGRLRRTPLYRAGE